MQTHQNDILSKCVLIILLVSTMSQAATQHTYPTGHVRSPLLRAVYDKMIEDERQRNDKHEYWYNVDSSKFTIDTCSKFIQFNQDAGTTQFLNLCREKSDWIFTQIGHSVCKSVLSWFMSATTINGLLKRGSMFVFSEEQLKTLLDVQPGWHCNRMMDLGAGDGKITEIMAKYCDVIDVTEMSPTMLWRLQEKAFNVVSVDSWDDGSATYDLIGCLNLLDRCDKPMKILQSIHKVLKPETGRAIVAVVLPFEPYVEYNSTDHNPTENLLIRGRTFEEQASSFINDVFEPSGFVVEKFTRLPYLCEGDMHKSFYVLNDAVFVLKLKDTG